MSWKKLINRQYMGKMNEEELVIYMLDRIEIDGDEVVLKRMKKVIIRLCRNRKILEIVQAQLNAMEIGLPSFAHLCLKLVEEMKMKFRNSASMSANCDILRKLYYYAYV